MTDYKHIIGTALLLGIFAVFGTSLLSSIHFGTKDRIAAQEKAALLASLNALIPASEYDNDIHSDVISVTSLQLHASKPITVYRARKDNKPIAAILMPTAPDGYNGDIILLVGVYYDGTVAGVRVLKHKETPGLGDGIEIKRSNWIKTFDGKSLTNPDSKKWAVKKDGGVFDAFTGATITPRAVIKAVHKTLLYFETEKDNLFNDK